jgi:hypothetical protein
VSWEYDVSWDFGFFTNTHSSCDVFAGRLQLYVCTNDDAVKVYSLPSMDLTTTIRCGAGAGRWGGSGKGEGGVVQVDTGLPGLDTNLTGQLEQRQQHMKLAMTVGCVCQHVCLMLDQTAITPMTCCCHSCRCHVPINYAALSPNKMQLACVGDCNEALLYTVRPEGKATIAHRQQGRAWAVPHNRLST